MGDLDYRHLFAASPAPFLVVAPDAPRFTIREVNSAYLAATGRTRDALIGRGIFEAFPDNPDDADATGVANLRASLERALATKQPDVMPVQKYDIPRPGGGFEERWWDPVNTPVLNESGEVTTLIHHVTDVTSLRRTERALGESEARWREVFERMGEGFEIDEMILGPDGRVVDFHYVDVNAAWERQSGFPREMVIGRRATEVFPPEETAFWVPLFGQVAQTGEPAHIERYFPPAQRWLEVLAYRLEAGRVAVLLRDVTERHLAEDALRRSQAEAERQRRLYEAILNNTPDLAYIFDLGHRFIYANEGLLRTWGRSWDEAIGKTCLELGYPDWHAAVHDREIEQVIASRQPIRGQVPFTGTFGRRIYDYIFVPVLGADGQVEAVAGTTRDVTEQQQIEAALRESQARLTAALSAAKMASWRWDPVEDRIAFSATAPEVFGLLPGATLESSAAGQSLLHPEDAGRHRALVRDAAERGAAWHTEFRIIRPRDGKVAWLEERASAERDVTTGELRMTGLVWDITERKEAEERQRLLSREVDHRAKNALAVVQSALRLTRAEDLPSYVQAVTGRVSALARAQTLLAEDQWHGADLQALLEGELAPFIGADHRVVLDGPRVVVPAHAAQPIAMAVHELATNAVKYGALSVPSGRVTALWRLEGGPARTLYLRWTETGGPPVASPPSRHGFGSRVLEGTVRRQLGGTVSRVWEQAGLVCTIEVPLDRHAAALGAGSDVAAAD
ncbi:PAS domain-containing sensor histidine kinase [Roseicella aquatilis]|uniref:histidine kinase n=1 Tax=Roseicella aquatilis TaxID=2527868 RepID=A0A4V2WL42_9PROT|nr:PAS domain S-box protein [Roseicella aquatilis]TCZ61094.1 PAS domain S-box protein [Roseicella aquatilis]